MATPAKKPKLGGTNDELPKCPYGEKCYRKNPDHFKEFTHGSKSPTKDDSKDDVLTRIQSIDHTKLKPCKYGAKCFRKNLLHFAEFSHPVSVTAGVVKAAGSSSVKEDDSDTDEVDSDEETTTINSHLNRGLSLMKDFTCMSEKERKQLILKALEAKQALADELSKTKKAVRDKMKQLRSLQKRVNQGTLKLEGEEEAMKGTKIVYFPLLPERDYKENSASQTHFRLAESQFYRLQSEENSYRVTKVEYVVNPPLVKRFREARDQIRTVRGEDLSYPVLAFHGTDESNILPICETGFRTPADSKFEHKTDTGWYGKGVYFSEYPNYSMDYIDGAEKLLLCQVLPGKVYQCTKLIHGAALQAGYDSHTSPDRKELVVFDSAHILPQYIVHYTDETLDAFTYSGDKVKREIPGPVEMKELYDEAVAKPKSTVLNGQCYQFSGTFAATQAKMQDLVKKHGATVEADEPEEEPQKPKGMMAIIANLMKPAKPKPKFCGVKIHVLDREIFQELQTLPTWNKNVPALSEDYVYKSIIDGELHDATVYQFR